MTIPLPVPHVGDQDTQINFDALAGQFPLGPHQAHHQIYPQARVYNDAAISVATSGAAQALTFNSERYDYYPAGYTEQHSTSANTSRLTCRVPGLYEIGGHVGFAANATGLRRLLLKLNGATYFAIHDTLNIGAGDSTYMSIVSQYRMAVGDYVELFAQQNSGGALNVTAGGNYTPEFWFGWISP